MSLFDLCELLNFKPKQIALNGKLSIAFGARGRGANLAHFEPNTYTINLTRYARPKKGSTKEKGFDRTKLLVQSGGVGALAHEFAHAIDYYGGEYLQKTASGALSGGRLLRIRTDKVIMTNKTPEGQMEKIIHKIIWKSDKQHSPYFLRLKKANLTDYYFRRNELFARAFESYIHYKLAKKTQKNIFLAESKYDLELYLSPKEIKPIEKDMDELLALIRKRL